MLHKQLSIFLALTFSQQLPFGNSMHISSSILGDVAAIVRTRFNVLRALWHSSQLCTDASAMIKKVRSFQHKQDGITEENDILLAKHLKQVQARITIFLSFFADPLSFRAEDFEVLIFVH
jgi:hypothetical protein